MDQLYYYEKLFIIHLGGIRISLLDGTQAMKPAVLKRLELKGREYIIYVADGWTQHSQRMEDVCICQKDWNNTQNRSVSCLLSPWQFLSRNKNRKIPNTGNLFPLSQALHIYPHLPPKKDVIISKFKKEVFPVVSFLDFFYSKQFTINPGFSGFCLFGFSGVRSQCAVQAGFKFTIVQPPYAWPGWQACATVPDIRWFWAMRYQQCSRVCDSVLTA